MRLLNGYKFKEFNNSFFVLIFRQEYPSGGLFANDEECNKSLKSKRFSVIGSVDERFKVNEKYHFLLEYPELSAYLEWEQALPITTNSSNLEANVYNKTFKRFQGLSISFDSTRTCFDGSPGKNTNSWWYSVGMINPYNGRTIPGPVINNCIYVNEVLLWMKFDNISVLYNLPAIHIFLSYNLAQSISLLQLFYLMILLSN